MRYFVAPTHCLAANHRAGTTALAKVVVTTFYPELLAGVNDALPAAERFNDPHVYKALCPTTEEPERQVLVLVREPVERFLSMLSLLGMGVGEALADEELMAGDHFAPQAAFECDKAFRFPDQIAEFCAEAGLPGLELVNEGGPKPEITDAERGLVEARYADDVKLYRSL